MCRAVRDGDDALEYARTVDKLIAIAETRTRANHSGCVWFGGVTYR